MKSYQPLNTDCTIMETSFGVFYDSPYSTCNKLSPKWRRAEIVEYIYKLMKVYKMHHSLCVSMTQELQLKIHETKLLNPAIILIQNGETSIDYWFDNSTEYK